MSDIQQIQGKNMPSILDSCINGFAEELMQHYGAGAMLDYAGVIFALESVMEKNGIRPEEGLLFERTFKTRNIQIRLEKAVRWTDEDFLEAVAYGVNLSKKIAGSLYEHITMQSDSRPLDQVISETKQGLIDYYNRTCEKAVLYDSSGKMIDHLCSPFDKQWRIDNPGYDGPLQHESEAIAIYTYLSDAIDGYLRSRERPFDPGKSIESHIRAALMGTRVRLQYPEQMDPSKRKAYAMHLVLDIKNEPGKIMVDEGFMGFIYNSVRSYVKEHGQPGQYQVEAAIARLLSEHPKEKA